MGTWKAHIAKLNEELTGKKVFYNGEVFTIAAVDYNGIVHIDKPGKYTKTTAVYWPDEARKALVQ